VGLAGQVTAWLPRPGIHRLALVDAANRAFDSVTFEVRGSLDPVPD